MKINRADRFTWKDDDLIVIERRKKGGAKKVLSKTSQGEATMKNPIALSKEWERLGKRLAMVIADLEEDEYLILSEKNEMYMFSLRRKITVGCG